MKFRASPLALPVPSLLGALSLCGCAVEPALVPDTPDTARQAACRVAPPPDSPWAPLGLCGAPAWVDSGVERRLHMLGALPGIEATAQQKASAYLGTQGPGISLGLVLDDGLFYSRGFGFADVDRTKTPDENTVYGVASFTKVITGTALRSMLEHPEFSTANRPTSLDQPVQTWVPEVQSICPPGVTACAPSPTNAPITLRQLVSHTAGMANELYNPNSNLGNTFDLTESQWMTVLRQQTLAYTPGRFEAYAGIGPELEGLIIGRTALTQVTSANGLSTRDTFNRYVEDHVLAPLGMSSSRMTPPTIAQGRAQNWSVVWQTIGGVSYPFFNPAPAWTDPGVRSMAGGNGGLYTTVRDLSRFMGMWLGNNGMGVLSPAALADMRTRQVPGTEVPTSADRCTQPDTPTSNGYTVNNGGYSLCGRAGTFGVHWALPNCTGTAPCDEMAHNGSNGVWGSQTWLRLAQGLGATVLVWDRSNRPDPSVGVA